MSSPPRGGTQERSELAEPPLGFGVRGFLIWNQHVVDFRIEHGGRWRFRLGDDCLIGPPATPPAAAAAKRPEAGQPAERTFPETESRVVDALVDALWAGKTRQWAVGHWLMRTGHSVPGRADPPTVCKHAATSRPPVRGPLDPAVSRLFVALCRISVKGRPHWVAGQHRSGGSPAV